MVLANGTVVHASEKENPDLFWALRGAGSSFGIIVDFEFETFSVPEQTTWIDVATNLINGTKDEAVNGLVQWQKLLLTEGVAPELNMRFNVIKEVLEVVYHGNKEDARKALQPLEGPLKLDWDADRTTITQGKWLDSLRNRSGGDPLNITDSYDGVSGKL